MIVVVYCARGHHMEVDDVCEVHFTDSFLYLDLVDGRVVFPMKKVIHWQEVSE